MLDTLRTELDNISEQDIAQVGLTFVVRKDWYVRLAWYDTAQPVDKSPLYMLLDARPELLTNITTAQGVRSLVATARDLDTWSRPRGYSVGVSGGNWRTRLSLMVFDWLGGFR